MASSKEVFELRRNGSLDEAYEMAILLIDIDPSNEWNIKALAWCLYDMVKRAVSRNDYEAARSYSNRLSGLGISDTDELLFKAVVNAQNLASPERKIILKAKEFSKQGNHKEALALFKKAIQDFPDDPDLNTQYAWELYKEGKLIFEEEKVDVYNARKLLADYIGLKNEKPSQLHSLFLRFADKILDREEFDLLSFLHLWDLTNLREEDFEPFVKDDKTFASIAEKVIQHGAKLILDKRAVQELDFFLPFLDKGISRFPENIWLPYYKAKLLHLVNRNEEAINFLIPVVKGKMTEYWTWSYLAELVLDSDKNLALSCYCKSMLCRGEEKYIANVRMKFAELLVQKGFFNEAKLEIDSAIKTKDSEGSRVAESIREYQKQDWYKNTTEKKNNIDFYKSNKQPAEELIFRSLVWSNGCVGETFTIPEKPDKPRRKLYLNLSGKILEVVVSDKKYGISSYFKEGDAIKLKGEYDIDKTFQVYLIERRSAPEKWDLFEWFNGNVIHPVKDKNDIVDGWFVSLIDGDKIKEGVLQMKDVDNNSHFKDGAPVLVKYFQKQKVGLRIPWVKEKEPNIQILSIKDRSAGQFWDLFPTDVGTFDHVNDAKKIAHFIVNKKIDGTIKFNQLRQKPEVGMNILIRLRHVMKESDSYYVVLTCEVTQQSPVMKLLRSFSGDVTTSGSIG
ncbi:MAG: tetratricopeptide repeat protein, partial [Bacteroidales bacterium]|nr:tetratricopeptide repeat protein [Bacteroidales bacterium]